MLSHWKIPLLAHAVVWNPARSHYSGNGSTSFYVEVPFICQALDKEKLYCITIYMHRTQSFDAMHNLNCLKLVYICIYFSSFILFTKCTQVQIFYNWNDCSLQWYTQSRHICIKFTTYKLHVPVYIVSRILVRYVRKLSANSYFCFTWTLFVWLNMTILA